MKRVICVLFVLASLFLVSCAGETPIASTEEAVATTATTTVEVTEPTAVLFASALHHAALESPSRILLFHGNTLWYYSKADGESYRFCFNPLCQHTLKENCLARSFMSHSCTSDLCVYSEKNNRFYFARGQHIYSTSFDASDLKLECSFGETGALDQMKYPASLSILRMYDDYVYFRRTNDDTGKRQIVRYNVATRKIEELTSADDEWVIGYEIADGYIYFKTIDNDNNIRYYTTDMDFKERKIVFDPIYPANAGVSMGLYDGKYFYERIAGESDGELYRINPLTGEKSLIVKDERLSASGSMIMCVKEDGLYFSAGNFTTLGYAYNGTTERYDIGTMRNSIWRISFNGEFTKILDFPRGEIETLNFVDGGVIIHFNRIYHKEIDVEDPKAVGGVFVLFKIDENGNFINPKPIGNNADNEDLIKFLKGV